MRRCFVFEVQGLAKTGQRAGVTENVAMMRQSLKCCDETRRSRGDLAAFAGGATVRLKQCLPSLSAGGHYKWGCLGHVGHVGNGGHARCLGHMGRMRCVVKFSGVWGARLARGNTLGAAFRRLTKCGFWGAGGSGIWQADLGRAEAWFLCLERCGDGVLIAPRGVFERHRRDKEGVSSAIGAIKSGFGG